MSRPVFLGADWKHLALLNYRIDPSILLPFLPAKTELDFYQGHTYVSLVAFLFHRTTLSTWVPAFFHRDFEEVNLRFYVTRKDSTGIKRGVVFIKEIVPKPFLAWTARKFYHENYVSMPMSSNIQEGQFYEYTWGTHSLKLRTDNRPFQAAGDSLERWITEHYWGYTQVTDSKTYEYKVKHPVWNLFEVQSYELTLNSHSLYGVEFTKIFNSKPHSQFLADGSPVTVHWPRLI
jgi:uncharacterized protein YqjF (DUF2071 family)